MTPLPPSSCPKRSPRTRRAGRPPLLAALLLAAVALPGCADLHHVEVGAVPDDYRTRHPIVVTEAERTIEIPVASSETGLSLSARSRVEEFATRFRASEASTLRIAVPAGTWNEAAARLVAADISTTLARRGVPKGRVVVSPYPAAGLEGPVPVRLSYSALAAEVAPCGRWPEDLGNTHQNRNYENFGCATQQNLAAQIADPRDLLAPRGMSEIDAERRTDMLGRYRRGEATGSEGGATESDYSW